MEAGRGAHDDNVATMSVLTYFKPESGPVGSALGGWLDFAPSGLATRFFLLWFVILYTAFQVLSFASLGLHPDMLEAFAWGLHPSAGYDNHPPLYALMAGVWFAVFPPTDWAFHLLAIANAALGLFATDLIARMTGQRPVGWNCVAQQRSPNTTALLAELRQQQREIDALRTLVLKRN